MNQAERSAQFTEYVVAKQLWLRRLAYLLCRDWHRSDDLVQTTLVKLYANWHRVEDNANPDGYARTILVNSFISEERGKRWKRILLVRDVEEHGGDASRSAQTTRDRASGELVDDVLDLRRALLHLPARQRATLVLRYYCELSVEEAAQALNCSAGTVKSQTSRALESLRRLMHVDEPGDLPDGGPAVAAITDVARLLGNHRNAADHGTPAYNRKG